MLLITNKWLRIDAYTVNKARIKGCISGINPVATSIPPLKPVLSGAVMFITAEDNFGASSLLYTELCSLNYKPLKEN